MLVLLQVGGIHIAGCVVRAGFCLVGVLACEVRLWFWFYVGAWYLTVTSSMYMYLHMQSHQPGLAGFGWRCMRYTVLTMCTFGRGHVCVVGWGLSYILSGSLVCAERSALAWAQRCGRSAVCLTMSKMLSHTRSIDMICVQIMMHECVTMKRSTQCVASQ